MKKIILFLFVLACSLCGYAQFNPSLHQPTNKPIGLNAAAPVDARSFYYDAVNFSYRPYANRAEVLAYLNLAKYRTGNFAIIIDSAGKNWAYWFRNCTHDTCLVRETMDSASLLAAYLTKALQDGRIFVGNALNVATPQLPSGDLSMTNSGVFSLATTGVVPGVYSNPSIAVDAKGRVTAVTSGTGGVNNTNTGTGYRVLRDPTLQTLRTLYSSNTILWDSTSNSDGLTAKVDTTAVVATKYDLTQVVSGINQLTGDVTAGPGAGSQAATIAANAVTDSKLRQSAGLSVVGRSANSTGNVADVIAGSDNTLLRRSGTSLGFGQIGNSYITDLDYSKLTNTPSTNPGVYFSPAQQLNPGFIVFATAIVYPTNTFVNGTPVTWGILDHASGHNSSFIDSAYGNTGTGELYIRYPRVRYVMNGTVTPDEVFSRYGIVPGSSIGLTEIRANMNHVTNVGFRLRGDGAGNWTIAGLVPSLITTSTYNTTTALTGFNLTPLWGVDYASVSVTYCGTSNYRIRRQYTGLGIYAAGFVLVDEFNNPVTVAPTTNDEIFIANTGTTSTQVNMATWFSGNNWMTNASNFWVFGVFECWMVAAPVSSTSIQVRWQTDYPSATNYKILRSSSGLYGPYTLVHTGTSGSYVDAGLTPNTLYTYKMVAVISGVDTDITTFNANTKF